MPENNELFYRMTFGVNGFDNLTPTIKTDYDFDQSFDGISKLNSWTPLEIKRIHSDSHAGLLDAPYFYLFPVFSKKAMDCLYPIIKDDIEILPLVFEGNTGVYFGINVIKVLDVIDYETSEFVKFNNSNKILAFQKYSLKNEKIENNIFKIIDEPRGSAFVSYKVKNIVQENNLSGFIFESL